MANFFLTGPTALCWESLYGSLQLQPRAFLEAVASLALNADGTLCGYSRGTWWLHVRTSKNFLVDAMVTLRNVSWSFSSTILSPYTRSASCSQRRTRSSGLFRISPVENKMPCPPHTVHGQQLRLCWEGKPSTALGWVILEVASFLGSYCATSAWGQ